VIFLIVIDDELPIAQSCVANSSLTVDCGAKTKNRRRLI
jgi:hypothetical protein